MDLKTVISHVLIVTSLVAILYKEHINCWKYVTENWRDDFSNIHCNYHPLISIIHPAQKQLMLMHDHNAYAQMIWILAKIHFHVVTDELIDWSRHWMGKISSRSSWLFFCKRQTPFYVAHQQFLYNLVCGSESFNLTFYCIMFQFEDSIGWY